MYTVVIGMSAERRDRTVICAKHHSDLMGLPGHGCHARPQLLLCGPWCDLSLLMHILLSEQRASAREGGCDATAMRMRIAGINGYRVIGRRRRRRERRVITGRLDKPSTFAAFGFSFRPRFVSIGQAAG
jgi:hypothetical protein